MSEDFLGKWHAWRERRETGLAAPHGFLAITGLHWLDDVPRPYPGAPGCWWLGRRGVAVELDPGESLRIGDRTVTGRAELGPVDQHGLRASWGDAVVEVARRGDGVMLRPRHPDHPLRARHRPTPAYEPSTGWVLPARLVPDPGTVALELDIEGGALLQRQTQEQRAVGRLQFEYDGGARSLLALDNGDGELWVLFADATSGAQTYPAGRQLVVEAPRRDGSVEVDFNRAFNLPCAYTPYTTCPVPPAGNRLPFPVTAGELLPVP